VNREPLMDPRIGRFNDLTPGALEPMRKDMDQLCHRHHDRLAERRCEACETPICTECVLREQTGLNVCSFACADRLAVLARQKEEAEKLDPLPTRIWTSIFLIVVLSLVGGLAGGFLCFAQLTKRHGYRGEHFPELLRTMTIVGAICGAGTGCGFLIRYYRRKL
jgi:hypothetical protein